jgi:site-specific recombinase XerD
VNVYTRHSESCPHDGKPHYKRCDCFKYIYLLKDGKRSTISAKTRSWSVAEKKAQDIRDSWDPVKRKLKELDDRQKAEEAEVVSLEYAVDRWLRSIEQASENENTTSKYKTLCGHLKVWGQRTRLDKLTEVTPDAFDDWITSWRADAEYPGDRIGKTTAARRLEMIKRFTKYCVKMRWLAIDPAAELDAITPDDTETLPLLDGRYEAVLQATYRYDEEMRPDDRFGPELRAIIELMRWSGLRISDALKTPKDALVGNRLNIKKIVKTGKALTLIIPNHVCEALWALSPRPTVDSRYFFWSGVSKTKSLTGQWQRKLYRLNQYLDLKDYEGNPLGFHSHQLRDTFAVEHLLSGTLMEDLSAMLGHASIKVTEKYYAPWVPQRQAALELKMAEAIKRMGADVSIEPGSNGGAS